ncbi:Zinc finger protein [Wickerhamomyces ciferrii]|uniref:Zinc finger protein n=1 Tax=Wickerhamomyces ciferrii (strain ATCC 14091 / BCRC 22168 / CBS 111 / JCM 3599 / NBRC 0793 / NRRL Y-1031 F-60-10) TaxID=1206466 RepID=K0KD84_WICCF|nr:Zinc finger protein [Wickerhamomyces ciferrii]CCH43065.1 Zinc finger protein [Wickerhamomyces ciferrii]
MMSSPSHLHQPLGLSQYQNMMNESPVKAASYYFHSDNSQSNEHGQLQHDLSFQDENFKSGHMNLDPEISQQFLYSDDNQDSSNFIVPVSQNDSNSHLLQYPPRFDQHQHQQGNNTLQPPIPTHHHQQQQQQQQQHQQGPLMHSFQHNPNSSSIQSNLYPPMEFLPNSHSNNSINQIPESTSTNTLSSYDSVPLLTSSLISSSVSDNSIASPISFQHNSAVTPRRPNRRPSFSVTPLPSIYQTPAQLTASGSANNLNNLTFTNGSITSPIALKTGGGVTPTTASRRPRHRRTRSRLSLDANGAASIVTINPSNSLNNIKSPANFALQNQSGSQSAGGLSNNSGTNPFYTPPAFLSPHQGSPATTPLATPSIEKKRSQSNFESISPSMLMNSGLIPQNNSMMKHQESSSNEKNDENDDTVFMAAADLTMKLASKLANQSSDPQKFLVDPLNSDINQFNIDQTPKIPYVQQQQQQQQQSHQSQQQHHHGILGSSFDSKPNISRSQSSINLASIASSSSSSTEKPHTTTNPNDPYQVKHYDILQPRKKIQKSNSTTNINDSLNGKKPKKVHACPLCAAVFQRPEHVKRHMRSHSSEKPYVCDEPGCGKRFNRGDNLKAHLRKIHQRPI